MKEAISQAISPKELQLFEELLLKTLGLRISESDRKTLEKRIQSLIQTFGFQTAGECLDFLKKTPMTKKVILSFARDFTIGETYFFRHMPTYEALEQTILPALIQSKSSDKTLKIWSAGCCSGEEIYTIAIILDKLLFNQEDWNITLLGTDINEEFLNKAKNGKYKKWSFRGTPPEVIEKYFSKTGEGDWVISKEIRQRVTFENHNLINDPFPNHEEFDIILCNNVLIYLTDSHIQTILKNFAHCLKKEGWLILSCVEVPLFHEEGFSLIKSHNTTFFQKTTQKKTLKPLETITENHYPLSIDPPMIHSKHKPENKAGLETLLKESYEKRNFSEVIETFENHEKNENLPTESILLFIKSLANTGKLLQARDWCERALKKNPVSYELHYLLGVILLELDESNAAQTALKRSLFLNPHYSLSHFVLGTVYQKLGRVREMNKEFENTLYLLNQESPDAIVPGSDDLTNSRLISVIQHYLGA